MSTAARTATRSSPRSCSAASRQGRPAAPPADAPRDPPRARRRSAGDTQRPCCAWPRSPAGASSTSCSPRSPACPRTNCSTDSAPRSAATSSSSRPATAWSATRSATRSSRRSCTTTCCRASAATLHRAFAEALEERTPGGGAAEAAAGPSWRTTGPPPAQNDRAFAASVRAAEAAMGSYAFGAALDRVRTRARAVGRRRGSSGSRRLRPGRAARARRARRRTWPADYRRAVAHREEADRGARPRSPTRSEQASCARSSGGPVGARRRDRRPRGVPRGRGDHAGRPADRRTGARLSGLGQILMLVDRYDRIGRPRARRRSRSPGRSMRAAQEGHALQLATGVDLTLLGTCADGMVAIREALEIGWQTRTSDDIGRAYVNLVESFYDCGDTGRAIEVAVDGIRTSDELGMADLYGHYIRLNGAVCAYAVGRWDLARTWAEEAVARAPTGWGAELYRFANTLVAACRGRQLRHRRRGAGPTRSTSSTRPRAPSSSARSTQPQWNASCGGIGRWMRWRWPNAASTGWPPPRTGSRRCDSAASPCGRPRTWAKPLGRRATAARSTTHVSDSPAWPRGSTSSKRASRVPMAVANWPPTG